MPNDSNEPQQPFTPPAPQVPPQPTGPFQPFPPVEQTPVTEPTPPIVSVTEPTPEPKKSKKKWIFISAGVALLAALLIGGYFGLKTWADNAATNYARAVDTQFDEIFAKETRTERLELMKKDRPQLEPVLLGSVVSPSYKNAKENLTPIYNKTLDLSIEATQAARDATDSLRGVISSIQEALSAGKLKDYSDKQDLDFEAIGESIINSFEVANKLDAAADQLEAASTLSNLPSYKATIEKTHEWASVRREIAYFSATWLDDIANWAESGLNEIVENLKTLSTKYDTPSFDTASYKAKMDELDAHYITVSNDAVNSFSDLVDEQRASGQTEKVQALLDEANKQLDLFDKKLLEFLSAEELNNEG